MTAPALKTLLDRFHGVDGMNRYQLDANSISSLRVDDEKAFRDTRVIVKLDAPSLPSSIRFARLDHAISGIASEAGELAEHLKHVRFHGKALDIEHVIKELGDLLWYVAEACAALGCTMAFVAARNIMKLAARYPEGHFSIERSENRDPNKE